MFVQLVKDFQGQKAGTRIDVTEADAKTLLDAGIAAKVEGDQLAPLVQKSMEGMLAGITDTLTKSIDAVLKQFAEAHTRSNKNKVKAIFGEDGDGDPKKTFGRFLLAVMSKDSKTLDEMGSKFCDWDQKTAMATQTGTSGGFLVPTEFLARLLSLVTENSICRSLATVIPMSARSVQIPALDVTTAPAAGDTAFLGGVVARWTEEAAQLNETEPNLKQIELVNYELSGYSKVSNTMLADSAIGLEAFLYQLFARAIAWYEDYAFLRGNGTAKPLGIFNWQGIIATTRNTTSHVKLADIANMFGKLLPGGAGSSVVWVIHPTVLTELIQLTGGNNVLMLQNQNLGGEMTHTMLGKPIAVTEKVPALGTQGDIGLYDFSQYLIGDRQQIEIAFSEHVAFLNNQSVWRFVSRVGGMPWLKDKITLSDATSTLSPFVQVAA